MAFFKNIFKHVINDKDPKDNTVTVKDKPKPKYYGTVVPYPNFSASNDAAVLKSAIETKGVDEAAIIAILVKRSNEQRQMIKAVFEASAGKVFHFSSRQRQVWSIIKATSQKSKTKQTSLCEVFCVLSFYIIATHK